MALNPLSFLKESRAEFTKVIWPTRSETLRLTLVVIIVSLIIGLYVAGLDAAFTSLVDTFLKR